MPGIVFDNRDGQRAITAQTRTGPIELLPPVQAPPLLGRDSGPDAPRAASVAGVANDQKRCGAPTGRARAAPDFLEDASSRPRADGEAAPCQP